MSAGGNKSVGRIVGAGDRVAPLHIAVRIIGHRHTVKGCQSVVGVVGKSTCVTAFVLGGDNVSCGIVAEHFLGVNFVKLIACYYPLQL